ncbi:hypothetical protein [Clostridium paraputrificum]|uniref:hypothetical protein n=1 Tax=Clostridium paraputrificum TaxID=29363 RepID=UPI00374FBEA0
MGIGWRFPLNDDGQISGINDSSIETFRGNPFKSLAREICQNSLDAVKDINKPVRVEFKKFEIPNQEIPEKETLKKVFCSCMSFWKEMNDKKTYKFFDRAYCRIIRGYISVLRISDFNTTGLDGSRNQFNSNWSNLIKGSGVSDKGGNAGGSFGIGKAAPFVCSDFRTVFYSTLDKEGNEASQGVSRLVSFQEQNGITQGVGYYGNTYKNTPIYEMCNLDKDFKREEPGTDLFILGFTEDKTWKEQIISAALEGFLISIWKGLLEIQIDNILINKDNLGEIIEKYKENLDEGTKNYYKVLTSSNAKKFDFNFNYLGNVELYLLLEKGLHKKVCINRTSGMKIFDKSNLSTYTDFAGVLILEGFKVNSFFRQMETPAHDKWEPERHENPKEARKNRKELYNLIKDSLKELEDTNTSESLDIEGMGEYLADDIVEDINGNNKGKEVISDKISEVSIRKKDVKKLKKESIINEFDLEDEERETFGEYDEFGEGVGRIKTDTHIKNKGGDGIFASFTEVENGTKVMKTPIEVKPTKLRVLCTDIKNGEYLLKFISPVNLINCTVGIFISGERGLYPAGLNNALEINRNLDLSVNRNIISLGKLESSTTKKIRFRIDKNMYYAMEVRIYGYKA